MPSRTFIPTDWWPKNTLAWAASASSRVVMPDATADPLWLVIALSLSSVPRDNAAHTAIPVVTSAADATMASGFLTVELRGANMVRCLSSVTAAQC